EDGKVLANIVSSQVVHSKFGGVVPELAARNHIKIIMPLMKIALEVAHKELHNIDVISVTRGPGLIGALLVGLAFAKSLSIALNKPFIGINHLEGHIYALFLGNKKPCYPFLVLLVSGGHTEIVLVRNEFEYKTLGKTVDDACGEAFDKVAKLLGFPYPGGPYIEKAAKQGTIKKVKLPVPKPKGYNFSYAGLKTAVLYYTRDNPEYDRNDVATNFQEVAIEHLAQVTMRAVVATGVKHLGIVGGVSVNKRLRDRFLTLSHKIGIEVFIPDVHYCTDNGAMIALAGARRFKRYGASGLLVDAVSREPLDKILN
ncbi:hypothetical protein AMJ52_07405, partial [candidate division TA06 bacterium DG_78]